MPKLGWNRLAAMIAGAIAILLVAIVGGRWAIGWAQEAAQNRMYALGLVQLSESDPFQAVGVLLPGESPWRTAPADQSIGVDFAAAKDLPELRRCVARLGKCAMVSFDYPRPIHDPDVKAILDAAQPRTVIVTGGSISQGLIAALVATKSVVTLN
ncbi:MAG TPA: hypothetical protein VGE52_04705, partial [Pirellulales bacterium]